MSDPKYMGWVCPACNRINNPTLEHCPCNGASLNNVGYPESKSVLDGIPVVEGTPGKFNFTDKEAGLQARTKEGG